MAVLVTGGAGYIGSAAVKSLIEKDHDVVIVDNLSKGKRDLLHPEAKFYHIDLIDKSSLKAVFEDNQIESIIHFAGYKAVEESMKNPAKYNDNITGTLNLLELMAEYKVKKLIYSSSAAVYGMPEEGTIDESAPTVPINYYGYTKLASEQMIDWFSKLHDMTYISLRYFNVAGDAGLDYIDTDAKNILPIMMEVLKGKRDKLTIFGDDYNTRDGTCIRDYIDINDLVDAHILALGLTESSIINLGSSEGTTVKELIAYTEAITGKSVNHECGPRRPGDPAILVASNEKAKRILNWNPKNDIKHMIETTYRAYKKGGQLSMFPVHKYSTP